VRRRRTAAAWLDVFLRYSDSDNDDVTPLAT
jgi:hypothetical protein